MRFATFLTPFVLLYSCTSNMNKDKTPTTTYHPDPFINNQTYLAKTFSFPVGNGTAKNYYNAQKFRENNHLGEDWNINTGGNADLGEPILSIANGFVLFAEDVKGGWGNVIRILHKTRKGQFVESLYAHCDSIFIKKGDYVEEKQQIGTIGTAHGKYLAHLHFELRNKPNMPLGGGYSKNASDFLCPTEFIENNQ